MFAQKTKITILGLAISLTLIGCGPAFKANKGKAGPASVLSKTGDTTASDTQPNKTPEQLANEAQERLKREEAIKKESQASDIVETNDLANLYVSGVKISREGEDLVFSALVKETSQDNKGSVKVIAKIPSTANGVPTKLDASKITVEAIEGTKSVIEPKALEYSFYTTCQFTCSEVSVRLQRKNESVAYAAEFTFLVGDDQELGTLATSSLKENDKVTDFDKALIDAGVEVETAGSEVTGSEATSGEAADAAAKPADEAAPTETDKKEEAPAEAGEAAEDKAAADSAAAALAAGDAETTKSESAEDVAEMTVVESKGTAESALTAARTTAAPAAVASKGRAQISRDISVKKAQIDRKLLENKTALNAMNSQRSNMWKAKEELTKAQLEFARIDTASTKVIRTTAGAKNLARKKITDKTKSFYSQVEELKKKIKALENSTAELKKLGVEMKALKAQLAVAK
jgi:hypothetical protein